MRDALRHVFHRLARLPAVALLGAGLAACSGGDLLDDHNDDDDGNGGGSAPTAQLSPTGEIGINQPLVVTFSEPMDAGTLQLAGSMGTGADATWSEDDTLTLSPVDGWPAGAQTLVVDANDMDGESLATLEADYNVRLVIDGFASANVVIGQADFQGGDANRGGTADADTLDNPVGTAAFGADTLFIPDTGSARVLAFNGIPGANGANADFVIGQADFTSTAGGTSASSMLGPQNLTAVNGSLVVTDTQSHRVLIYDPLPATGPVDAAVVVGQPDMGSAVAACAASSLNTPEAHFVTPDGKLIVADSGNNRVLVWNELPASNGTAPDIVLGQGDFTHCTANDDDQDATPSPDWPPQAHTMTYPTGVWSDGERLIVADSGNNRVLIWDTFPEASFAPADHILGQNSFRGMDPNGGDDLSARGFDFPFGVWSQGSQIFVADRNNNRVLVWNDYPTRFFEPADAVIGQASFTNNAANDADQDGVADAAPSVTTLNAPTGVRLAGNRLVITDSGNSRVLVYESE